MTETPQNGKVAFDYVKSQFFRVIHADGAIGSVTPSGLIHVALYSERPSIPRRVIYPIDPQGKLGNPIEDETESRNSIVREMDVDVMLSLDAATNLRDWLSERIVQLQSQTNSIQR